MRGKLGDLALAGFRARFFDRLERARFGAGDDLFRFGFGVHDVTRNPPRDRRAARDRDRRDGCARVWRLDDSRARERHVSLPSSTDASTS